MLLVAIRALFLLICAAIGIQLVRTPEVGFAEHPTWFQEHPYVTLGGMLLLGAGVIALDVLLRRKQIATISAVYFGLVVGLLLSQLLLVALEPLLAGIPDWGRASVSLLIAAIIVYGCVSLLLQTKDDFRFIIPYVEFAKETKGGRPLILDTSTIIDGRIADLCETNILDHPLVVPRFVLQELQNVADSSDRLRRNRGRRGLDVLNRLRNNEKVEVIMHDGKLREIEGLPVDQRLVALAKHLRGRVVTNDFNLNKVAKLQGVDVVNLNDVANSLKPVFLPGEAMTIRIVKPGEEPGQGVGYLDDGTMVVVEQGRSRMGQDVGIVVTSVLQTSAGRMIFGRPEDTPEPLARRVSESAGRPS